ncbi:MAG: hypothetical protein PHZ19_00745 [Candidatus Thermoplasmatota archaeon]|nr:hypothetical protein [Candidatus Thermoplasmatota archaeon]
MLKNNCPYQVSDDAVVTLLATVETIACVIGNKAIEEFEMLNKLRLMQGLPLLKRLDKESVNRAVQKLFSAVNNNNVGLLSPGIPSPGGTKMSAKTQATKSAQNTISREAS